MQLVKKTSPASGLCTWGLGLDYMKDQGIFGGCRVGALYSKTARRQRPRPGSIKVPAAGLTIPTGDRL